VLEYFLFAESGSALLATRLPIRWERPNDNSNSSSLYIISTMVQISRIFALFSAISVGLAASVKRDFNDVKQGVDKVAFSVETLRSNIGGFSSTPSLATALVCIIFQCPISF
jgi:hypothetical protein